MSDSELLYHGPCENCGSSDANAHFSDGHAYCFSCQHYTHGDSPEPARRPRMSGDLIEPGDHRELRKRGISLETTRKWNYTVGEHKGRPVQIAPYYDESGNLVGQKIRYPDKTFAVRGKVSDSLFGQHLWGGGGKLVVVTEGEIDAMSVSQAQGNKWPVVSLPNGAQSAKKALSKNLDWLLRFEHVVLMFDSDEPGQEAIESVAPLFPPGRVKVATLPRKDANEMLVAGEVKELLGCMWNASPYRPATVVTVEDIFEEALKPIEWGFSWPWETLTQATYGIQRGRVYTYGAGTGVGKSDVFAQVAMHTRTVHGLPIAMVSLEQAPTETLNRLAGKYAGLPFHIPDGSWEEEQRIEALTTLRDLSGIYFRNQWGLDDYEAISQWMRWLVVSEGVKDIFVDHLTGIATGGDRDERETLEAAMAEFASLAKELDFTLHIVSHLNTPDGTPHEEGGRVMIKHFRGSRAIGYWSHFMLALERNTQEQDEAKRHITTFRILKDRLSGRGTGTTFGLRYDPATGLLHECALPTEGEAHGFKNEEETSGNDDDF